jgi:hypothetical protein
MVRPITGLDLGLLALSRPDGTDDLAPQPAEGKPGNLSLRRLPPELARLYLSPGQLASQSPPGGTMMARRVELGGEADLVTLGPAFHLDRMAVIRLDRARLARPEPEETPEDRSVQVLDASSLIERASEEQGSSPGFRVRRATESYRAMQLSVEDPSAPKR